MKKHVRILILVTCICIAFLLLISASLLFISEIAYKSNAGAHILACEKTLIAIGHAFETYRANHKGSLPSSLLELKDCIKEKYPSDSAGIPICVGNRNEDETGDTSYYVYNPSLSTNENRPICWDGKPHRIRSRLIPDTYIWNVLYADGHIERLRKRNFLGLMNSIGISEPNYISAKDYENGKRFYESNTILVKQNDIAIVFEDNYKKWKDFCKSPTVMVSSEISTRLNSPYYRNIVEIGPSAIPYIVQKSKEDPDFNWLGWAWAEITRITPTKNKHWESIENWWKGGRKQARERFESLYQKWKDDKANGKSLDADKMKKSIQALGIETLPFLIDKVKQGDTEWVEVISKLTAGKLDKNAYIFQCIEWWEKDKENWLIPFPNKQPVAEAGPDKVVKSGDFVQLDGSASNDADGDKLEYGWIQIAGPFIKLFDNSTAKPFFEAPLVRESTTLIFQLIVYDGSPIKSVHSSCQSGKSKPDTVRVVVNP
ncbi:MAG: hypothetical protein JW837_00225 [Sedimentisphaerales bacterium]|nr:hypothetical protein [Sedimentisphaerales bacterium]